MSNPTIPPVVTIRTARLLLRELSLADAPAVFAYSRLPEANQFVEWDPPASVDDIEEMIQRYITWQFEAPRRHLVLAITRERKVIGDVGLTTTDEARGAAELGFVLAPACWRQGLATEAAGAMLAYGLEEAGWQRIFATCDVENLASAAVLRKIGMQQEEQLRAYKYKQGRWRDSLLFGLSQRKWQLQYQV